MTSGQEFRPGQPMGAGRYTLTRQLGQGGMGLAWLARDEPLRKEVALKFIPPAVQQEPDCIEDLRRETARAQLLSHPNMVRILDLHEFPLEPVFISMEYVAGQTLDELRRQACILCRPLPRHLTPWGLSLDLASAGSNMPARMAMIAMMTSNSIRVKPWGLFRRVRAGRCSYFKRSTSTMP